MKKVGYLMSRSFAGEKTPAKASFLLTLKEDQQGRKNPIYGGEAVYQARTLLWIDVVDDLTVAPKSLKPKHPISSSGMFNLYPNPNDGNMVLEYQIQTNDSGVLSIYDVSGRLVNQKTLNSANNKVNIDATSLNAGAYYYNILVNGNKVKADKLIILK
ncbi:MAG: T9SS type A sorting domain-containing protein [Bacteroidota bacterium]